MQPITFPIEVPQKEEYSEIVLLWEKAVRATHHFLQDKDIEIFKNLILNKYLDAVELYCIRDKEGLAGFMGTSDDKIEMLFVRPDLHGKGVGKQLLTYAVQVLQKKLVDVNEQNERAVQFYKHCGFLVINRSEKDGLGNPYPILHMELQQ